MTLAAGRPGSRTAWAAGIACAAGTACTAGTAYGKRMGTKMTKTEKWERKLLDIGLRNTLINLRMSRRLVPLYTPSLDELEDGLFDGKEYALFPRPLD